MSLLRYILFINILLIQISICGFSQNSFVHPRGLLSIDELPKLREKVKREPFASMAAAMRKTANEQILKGIENIYDSSGVARMYAYLYALDGLPTDADISWKLVQGMIKNSEIVNNPVSRGLTRAKVLRDIAESYDLCYDAWSHNCRVEVCEKLIYLLGNTASNMGYDANYSIESNWMGVRYGAVLFASMVCDDHSVSATQKSRLLPFQWDANKRLGDHLVANINSNGWNTESLSYYSYNWTFVAPALVSNITNFGMERFSVQKVIPKALNALWGYSTATVSIPGINKKVMQPDFSDDDPMSSYFLYPFGLHLYPETQKPALLWMLIYLNGPDTWLTDGELLFYNILWIPEHIAPVNPSKFGWLTYFDEEQGIALFRNRFFDDNDIVAGFTATAKRVRGHQGSDNLGFRILGLGSIWAVGAGRTGQVAGQTTLFPDVNPANHQATKDALGKVLQTRFEKDGSGFMMASGSCMGVTGHQRSFRADYSKQSGAEAVFIVSDSSVNGAIWRMNSPEFNTLTIEPNGFRLVAPNGAEMKAVVFTDGGSLKISSTKVRYGGDTERLNSGIEYYGKRYSYTNAIDCNTRGRITVVFTLQPKGSKHPHVDITSDRHIRVGGIRYTDVLNY